MQQILKNSVEKFINEIKFDDFDWNWYATQQPKILEIKRVISIISTSCS